MAGIYVHIPYCHKACHYCDFHFSTSLKDLSEMMDAICAELRMRKDYLEQEEIDTIYFGGGTPSILSKEHLSLILETIFNNYKISSMAEITLEANPEDIHSDIPVYWKSVGINRLSIGIQTFNNQRLSWMNRNHTAGQSVNAVLLAKASGFENLTIDLIYGLPQLSAEEWLTEIRQAISLDIPHISSYCFTIEEKTVFGHQLKKGVLSPAADELTESHLSILMDEMQWNGYEQYEISNFCKPGFESRHNSNYWLRKKYLGIGPGAHSYNLKSRHYSISNNALYIRRIKQKELPLTTEALSDMDHYHEYLLTRLRTKWGVYIPDIETWIPAHIRQTEGIFDKLCHEGFMEKRDNTYFLTKRGKMLADEITLKLMI